MSGDEASTGTRGESRYLSQLQARQAGLVDAIKSLTARHNALARQMQGRSTAVATRKSSAFEKQRQLRQELRAGQAVQQRYDDALKAQAKAAEEVKRLSDLLDGEMGKLGDLNARVDALESETRGKPGLADSVDGLAVRVSEKEKHAKIVEGELREARGVLGKLEAEEKRLKEEKGKLEKRLGEGEQRRLELDEVLSEPIDLLDFEAGLLADLEKEIEALDQRLKAKPEPPEAAGDDPMPEMLRRNAERRRELEKRRKSLEEERKKLRQVDRPTARERSKGFRREPTLFEKQKMQELIERRAAELTERQQRLAALEREVDEVVAAIAKARASIVADFNRKAAIVESLQRQQKEVSELQVAIQGEGEGIAEDKDGVVSARNEVAQTKRRLENNERDRSRNVKSGSVLSGLRKAIVQKQEEAVAKERELQQRAAVLRSEQKGVEELARRHAVDEERIVALEASNGKLEKELDEAQKEARAEKEQVDALAKKIPVQLQKQFAGITELLGEQK